MAERDTGPHAAASVAGDLWAAFALLSRLPVPDHRPRGAAAAWAWPVVGAVLGAMAAAVATVALWLGLTPGMAAVAAMATGATLTGALHEDGLADTADGLFGGRDKARRLEIMKDSRIGSFGALALILTTLALWSGLELILRAGAQWPALIATGALSRVPMAVLMAALPNARGGGLAHAVGRPGSGTAALAAAIGLGCALLLCGAVAVPMAVAVAAVSAGLAAVARARIGGQTGDILGAGQQLAQLASVAVLAAALG